MAKKEIICVYQDCPLCGDRGKKLKKLIFDKKLNVRKVSFASPEGGELIHEAVFKHGIKTMPFFTDGTRFEQKLDDLLKRPKKTVKKEKGEDDNGTSSEIPGRNETEEV